jgi:hypothetical protein
MFINRDFFTSPIFKTWQTMKWLKILLAKSPPLYIINHKIIIFEGGLVRFMMNYIITKKFIPNYFFYKFHVL